MNFGTEVTVEQVKAAEKKQEVSQLQLAAYTYKTKNAFCEAATLKVNGMKEDYGTGVSTRLLIFNSTGSSIWFEKAWDWSGHIGTFPYVHEIKNGQWSAVLHVKTSGAARGSVGCVVYKGWTGSKEVLYNLCWCSPWSGSARVFTEVSTEFKEGDLYDKLSDGSDRSYFHDKSSNADIVGYIGGSSSPICTFELKTC